MDAIGLRDVRATFFYGPHDDSCRAASGGGKHGPPPNDAMHAIVASMEKYDGLSEEGRKAHRQWMRCGRPEDRDRLRDQLMQDLAGRIEQKLKEAQAAGQTAGQARNAVAGKHPA